MTKLRANVLHFALIPLQPPNVQDIKKTIDLILASEPVKQKGRDKDLICQSTIDGITPFSMALFYPELREESMKRFEDADGKYLLVALKMLINRLRIAPDSYLKEMEKQVKVLVKKLKRCYDQKIPKQVFHIVCRYNNAFLLKTIYTIAQVNVF